LQLGLEVQVLGTVLLACGIVLLVGLLAFRRTTRQRRSAVMLLICSVAFAGLVPYTALNLYHYCGTNPGGVHRDCVSDTYDGPLWQIVRPVRRMYWYLRETLSAHMLHQNRDSGAPAVPDRGWPFGVITAKSLESALTVPPGSLLIGPRPLRSSVADGN
jgi:hypothetical protein